MAVFQMAGTWPLERLLLKIVVRESIAVAGRCLIMLLVTLSGPGALLLGRALIIAATSAASMG